MDKNLTVQEALTKLLAEKKFLLNDGNSLMTELRERVASEHSMQLAFFQNALLDANIGEVLMLADEAGEDARDKAKAEAMTRLQKNNMPKKRAESVVQTLTEAMGWESPSSLRDNGRKFFPAIEDESQTSQQDIHERAPEPEKINPETFAGGDKTDNKTEDKTVDTTNNELSNSQRNYNSVAEGGKTNDKTDKKNSSPKTMLLAGLVVLVIIGSVIAYNSSNSSSNTEAKSTITTQQGNSLLSNSTDSLRDEQLTYTLSDLSLDTVSIGMSNKKVVSLMGECTKSYTERLPGYAINEYSNMKIYLKGNVVCGLYSNDINVKTKRGIHPGTQESEIEKIYGSPYETINIGSSTKVYMYKFELDDGTLGFLSFFVDDKKVKYIELETQPLAELAGAIQFLLYFHERITAHDFEAAYSCFDDDMKRVFSDYKKWTDGYKTTVKSEIIKITDADQSKKDKIILSYILKATDNPGGEHLFKGSITLIKVGDYFKIDDIENRVN